MGKTGGTAKSEKDIDKSKDIDRANAFVDVHSADHKALIARLAGLEAENVRLATLLGLIESYRAAADHPPPWMVRKKKDKTQSSAIACMQLSDLHLDEVVNPSEVGGLNAFSRAIAEQRLHRWAEKACEMGDRHR